MWTGLAVFAASALALGALSVGLLGSSMRSGLAPAGDGLDARVGALASQLEGVPPARQAAVLREAGVPAQIQGPEGAVHAQLGGAELWSAAGAPPLARLAAAGAAWRPLRGAVEVSRALPGGERLVARAGVGAQATAVGPAGWLAMVGVLLLSAVAGGATWFAARRRARHADALADALEAATAGRAAPPVGRAPTGSERITAAVESSVLRSRELASSSEAGLDALSSVIAPLPVASATRTGPRRIVRNDALERLVGTMTAADRADVETAVSGALRASGPVSRRLRLADGRALEVEAWPVPEGRVAICAERTEQERLGALRRRMTGSAAARMNAPVGEIQTAAAELHAQLPPATAPAAARILAAADRLQGMLASLLRTEKSGAAAQQPAAVGLAGVVWGLAQEAEPRLRAAGLRIELEIDEQTPPAGVDPNALTEILGELMANAERFTPRGGTLTLWTAPGGPDSVLAGVRDTGAGVSPDELDAVEEPFVRGRDAIALPGNGLGLGLARARAERMGARLTVDPGPGCNVTLELPRATITPPGAPPNPQLEPEEARLAA